MVRSQLSKALHIILAILAILTIAYLNFSLIRYWFSGEFNQNLASIEISYIQMAKFWSVSGFASAGWQPFWYLGYPWHVFYTPLLPFLEVLAHQTLNFSFAHAYRVITGLGYVLVPVSVYFFVWQIGKSKTGAMVAALFYSFVPSVIAVIFEEVAADTISGLLEPRRFAILVRWGEGPHTLALVFLPLFGLFLARYLEETKRQRDKVLGGIEGRERAGFVSLVAASFFLGLTALTNAIALWAAALLLLAFLLSELVRKSGEFISLLKGVLGLLVLTFGLMSFWYNLPFIKTFFREGGGSFANWLAIFPWGFLVFASGVFGIVFLVRKFLHKLEGVASAFFWFLMLFAIVYVYYASGENRLEYVPQALRLNTEVDLALAVLVGAVVSNLFLFFVKKFANLKVLASVLAVLLVSLPILGLLYWGLALRRELPAYTRDLSATKAGGIETTAEYRVAKKLAQLVEGSDQRVLAPGNWGFWLNYFVDVPQLRGALYQSSTHFWPEHIYYQVTNGSDPKISLAWLKIANIGKLVYTTGASSEPFRDYKVPQEKFEGILKEILSESGDVYYDVPLKNDSLAKVVDANSFKAVKKPFNAIDSEPIFAYVNWLEQKADRKLTVERVSASRWRISGEVNGGEAVLFQQTYDAGWRVENRGNGGKSGGIRGWKIVRDPLDFMVLVPKNSGKFDIELAYGRPFSVWLGYLITLGTVGIIIKRLIKGYQGKSGFSKGSQMVDHG